MAVYQWRQLAQLMPQSTGIETLYEANAGYTAVAKTLWVANHSGVAATYNVYHNDSAKMISDVNTLAKGLSLGISGYDLWEAQGVLMAANYGGRIAVSASVADGLTFTLYGAVLAAEGAPKMLFQMNPATTEITRISSPPTGKTWLVKSLMTSNVTSPSTYVSYCLYHSRAGESIKTANKLTPRQTVNASNTGLMEAQGILMACEYYDYMHVVCSKAGGLALTAYGEEFDS